MRENRLSMQWPWNKIVLRSPQNKKMKYDFNKITLMQQEAMKIKGGIYHDVTMDRIEGESHHEYPTYTTHKDWRDWWNKKRMTLIRLK